MLQCHEFVIPYPGVKRKVLYHFSDLHLAVAGDNPTPEEAAEVEKQAAAFDECRWWFSQHCKEPFDHTVPATTYFEEIVAACQDGDGVLCAGDLAECFNPGTLGYIEEKTAGLPFLTVCGNHDPAEKIPDGYALSAAKAEVQTLDLGDLLVLGFDNGKRDITPGQLAALQEALEGDKPLVILMHIPFAVAENEAMLRGCGEYFRMNYDGCPPENQAFVDLIAAHHQRIAAVLAGHLHFNHTCPVAGDLTQYVSSQGMAGHYNRYIIGE